MSAYRLDRAISCSMFIKKKMRLGKKKYSKASVLVLLYHCHCRWETY